MLPIVTREQSRQLDEDLSSGAGMPSLLLMENAGRGAADTIEREFPSAATLLVVCGTGNNGGDGLVVARRWLTLGKAAVVALVGEPVALTADAASQYRAFRAVGGQVVAPFGSEWDLALDSADLVVDALFGTGLSRPIADVHGQVIRALNAAQRPVVALDLPSGLDANTGQVLGACVRAQATVTFGCPKRGHFTHVGREFSGAVYTVDIGAPLGLDKLTGRLAFPITAERARAAVNARLAVGHKGQAGHVLVIAGSEGTVGAARLAAHGAFRAGAGLVTVATHPEIARALGSETWEVMVRAIGPDSADDLQAALGKAKSIVIGPGLGATEVTSAWLGVVLASFRDVVVVDADALTLLAQQPGLLAASVAKVVITPHPGEAARLLGVTTAAIESDRFGAVDELSARFGVTVVLKGAPSLVADAGALLAAPAGHGCLSTAGSGDVLAGIIGALGAQVAPLEAALTGAWLHATAGERLGQRGFGARGVLAREIADEVPELCAELAETGAVRRLGKVSRWADRMARD